ncbi:MAG: T9SS type A sorting domain-containing protein [Bacteroidota bacterium]|nr:T9SS type A sorting domain-containing protein [Bacteroidota bacterium]
MKPILLFKLALLLFIALNAFSYTYLSYNRPHPTTSQSSWLNGSGTIHTADILVYPKGNYAEVSVTLEISANGISGIGTNDTLEADFNFDLAPGSMIIDSWLWIDSVTIVRAKHLDRWSAVAIYENIVKRIRRDPSILTKNYNNNFDLKVYPFVGYGKRKFRITYLTPIQFINNQGRVNIPVSLFKISATTPKVTTTIYANPNYLSPKLTIDNKSDEILLSNPITTTISGVSLYNTSISSNFISQTNQPGYYYYSNTSYPYYSTSNNEAQVTYSLNTLKLVYGGYYSNSSGENFYELAFSPEKLLNARPNKRVCFVIDYDAAYSSLKRTDIYKSIRSFFSSKLDSNYFFNIVYGGYTNTRYKNNWIPATKKNLDSATVDTLRFSSDTTNPEKTISYAVDFVNIYDSTCRIVVITSNIKRYKGDTAIAASNRIYNRMETKVPIDILDHYYYYISSLTGGNTPAYSPWVTINNLQYYGNSFFYSTLCKKTGGNLYSSRINPYYNYNNYYNYAPGSSSYISQYPYTLQQYNNYLSNIVQSVKGNFDAFNASESLSGGLTYAKYYVSGNSNGVTDLNTYISYVGRYTGTFPLQLDLSALYKGKLYSKKLTVQQSDLDAIGNIGEIHWAGNYIASKENSYDNATITEIIDLSLKYRILSRYTALLSLEPSQGGDVCNTCDENAPNTNSGLPINTSATFTSIVTNEGNDDLFTVFPNPATDQITIEFNNNTGATASLLLSNISGQTVIESQVPYSGEVKQVYTLQLRDASGNIWPSGMYILKLIVGKKVFYRKLIIK